MNVMGTKQNRASVGSMHNIWKKWCIVYEDIARNLLEKYAF